MIYPIVYGFWGPSPPLGGQGPGGGAFPQRRAKGGALPPRPAKERGEGAQPQCVPHSALVASRAPSVRLANFAHTISGSISGRSLGESLEGKPQSERAMRCPRPTTLARG